MRIQRKWKRVLATLLCASFLTGIAWFPGEETKANARTVTQLSEGQDNETTTETMVINGKTITVVTTCTDLGECVSSAAQAAGTRADYQAKLHTYTKTIYVNDEYAAEVDANYEVWYFTDNKVHIYTRWLVKRTTSDYTESYFNYGTVVNTDGSFSYTNNDSFCLFGEDVDYTFPLFFYVTPTTRYFS